MAGSGDVSKHHELMLQAIRNGPNMRVGSFTHDEACGGQQDDIELRQNYCDLDVGPIHFLEAGELGTDERVFKGHQKFLISSSFRMVATMVGQGKTPTCRLGTVRLIGDYYLSLSGGHNTRVVHPSAYFVSRGSPGRRRERQSVVTLRAETSRSLAASAFVDHRKPCLVLALPLVFPQSFLPDVRPNKPPQSRKAG
jgi:hypothetical protein